MEQVTAWLMSLGLESYAPGFAAAGLTQLAAAQGVSEENLRSNVKMEDPEHRARLLSAAG
jgi:hypothetical protein